MRNRVPIAAAASALTLLVGCFTVHHTEYPEVQMTRRDAASAPISVQLSGFEALITEYVPIYGYETVWRNDPVRYRHGRYYGGGMHSETSTTTVYVPQTSASSAFVERAQDCLECDGSGFKVVQNGADYRIDVRFSGPMITNGDKTKAACCLLFSLLTADYSAQTWRARMKIYDALGNLVKTGDYVQRCSAAVWGPIPIFSPAGADDTGYNNVKCWCLNVLTDRAMADATAFLATASSKP